MSFHYKQKEVAKILKIKITEVDTIIKFFDSDPDDEWDLKKGEDYIEQGGHRFFSEEGAFAIADYFQKVYLPSKPKSPWTLILDIFPSTFKNWIEARKEKVKQQFAIQKIKDSLGDREINDLLVLKSDRHFIYTDDLVKIFNTSHSKLYQVFKIILKTDSPLILDKDYFEDIDKGQAPRNRYYSCLGIVKIARHLSEEETGLKQKNRRDWCHTVGHIIEPTLQKLLSEGTSKDNKIKKAMATAREMYNNQCQITGKKSNVYNDTTIEVHHIYDRKNYSHLADCIDNLITLHSKVHTEFHAWNQNKNKGRKNPESCTIEDLLMFAIERYPDENVRIDKLSNIKSKLNKVYNLNSIISIGKNGNEKSILTPENKIVTTAEEIASFYLIKTLLRDVIDVERLQYKDTQSYFGINLDGRVSRTICRLYWGKYKKYIIILDAEETDRQTILSTLDDLYKLETSFKERVTYLMQNKQEMTEKEIEEDKFLEEVLEISDLQNKESDCFNPELEILN